MSYHFIGIGGIGMSGLARILLQRGASVSGSDLAASRATEALQREGAVIHFGHAPEHVPSQATVVYSSAVAAHNPEYQCAQERGLPLWHRAQLLAALMDGYRQILVTGTHGKTTTASLLAHVFVAAGKDPAYAIGGVVNSLQTHAAEGKGLYFVAEADESDGSFSHYAPFAAVVTNADRDHLDYWQTERALLRGFEAFAAKTAYRLVWCADDPRLASLGLLGVSYGCTEQADARLLRVDLRSWELAFDLRCEGRLYADVRVPLIGRHNALNSAAVFVLCLQLGVPETVIRRAFLSFQGVGRRMERKGEARGIAVYDDYGHHPTEIAETLAALRSAAPDKRLVVAFQPHRYTRTRDCLELFAPALAAADVVVLTDIYAAGEAPLPGVAATELLRRLPEGTHYAPRDALAERLLRLLQPNDLLMTLGAGDVTEVGPVVLAGLRDS